MTLCLLLSILKRDILDKKIIVEKLVLNLCFLLFKSGGKVVYILKW